MPDDIDTETLAKEVLAELDPGTRIEDKFILSRRQLLAIAGGSGAVGLLTQLGIDEATAQSAAGQVGTSSEPVDVEAHQVNVANGVDMGGNDLTGVGAADIDELTADNVSVTQSNISNFTLHSGDQVTVSGDTYETIFNLSNPVDVVSGIVFGYYVGALRVTWDDGTTDKFMESVARGKDDSGNAIGHIVVPKFRQIKKLEFLADSGASFDFGYKVVTI